MVRTLLLLVKYNWNLLYRISTSVEFIVQKRRFMRRRFEMWVLARKMNAVVIQLSAFSNRNFMIWIQIYIFFVRYCFSPLELNPFSAKNSVMESFSFAFSSGRSCSRVKAESPVAEAEIRRDLLASSEGQELIDPSRVLSDGFLREVRSVVVSTESFLRVTSKLGLSDFLFVDFPERKVSFSFCKKLLINWKSHSEQPGRYFSSASSDLGISNEPEAVSPQCAPFAFGHRVVSVASFSVLRCICLY